MPLHHLPDVRDPRRVIALDAVHNFRDMGGYPTADGRTTRWRRLFRADALYRLRGDDVDAVRPLGLRTVVDLRTDEELELRGRFPVDDHPIDFHHVDVMDTTWERSEEEIDDVAAYLAGQYRKMLHAFPDRFARAIERLGAPEAMPAVFHCAAGKDRTGVTAMLILGALGVPNEYIAADYGLTAEATARTRVWAQREAPELWMRMADTPSAWMAAEPEAMLRVIEGIEAAHRSIRDYVLHIGVQPATLARLEAELLE
ncbi:MAG: tyrosine-protein phosphatase [Actinomycetota bacterium]|nr:tyrosine-protein phosphatase [Actinomycetota bacterium]